MSLQPLSAIFRVLLALITAGAGLYLVLRERRGGHRETLERRSHALLQPLVLLSCLAAAAFWGLLAESQRITAFARLFLWGSGIEWCLFALSIAAALVYDATWRCADRRAHTAAGWIFVASSMLSPVVLMTLARAWHARASETIDAAPPLPAPAGLLWILLVASFALHLVAMNLLLGGAVITAVAARRARREGAENHAALMGWGRRWLPVAAPAAIALGIPPTLLLAALHGQPAPYASLISVLALLLVGYGNLLPFEERGEASRWIGVALRWITVAAFMVVAFAETFRFLRPADPTLVFRFLHFLLGSIAVSGFAVSLLGLARRRRDAAFGEWAMRHGALWFSIATALNVVVGMMWLMSLPFVMRFLGGDAFATTLLGLGVLFAIGTLIMMMRAIEAPDPARAIRGSIGGLALTLLVMILLRDQVRRATLTGPYDGADPQWGMFAIFLMVALLSAAALGWTVTRLAGGRSPSSL